MQPSPNILHDEENFELIALGNGSIRVTCGQTVLHLTIGLSDPRCSSLHPPPSAFKSDSFRRIGEHWSLDRPLSARYRTENCFR
ncbi:hypothetical protein C8034_v004590 [Colletotrichum sidae]|uniref:Uncharacterized protein n=1 Tax=Colletotrichum sidae TaxID=1347389 RepID=A0A4R8TSN7_9PEZI|nr:hypothetical protein C8034_v004590 [Colletotrichum sidae]